LLDLDSGFWILYDEYKSATGELWAEENPPALLGDSYSKLLLKMIL
jgi:hypothetical protein